jgi:bifunctional non-homologous end joining protein LigD
MPSRSRTSAPERGGDTTRDLARASATREHHPSLPSRPKPSTASAATPTTATTAKSAAKSAKAAATTAPPRVAIPLGVKEAVIAIGEAQVRLTNLDKIFWPALGITKRELLQYYADVAHVLLPHIADRAMVMKRYPNGADGEPFFMKRAPTPRPEWIETCAIAHASGNVIDFPMIQDLAALLWVVNLGCIDLNPWYARCDDVDRPDYLHFDLDPVPGATWAAVVETAELVRAGLEGLGMRPIVKTTGSKGLHVYVAIVRGPTQKDVWRFAKRFAFDIAALRPDVITAEYTVAKRPAGRVLVDYNQNAWGRTLASAYSPRPRPRATVSAPITWDELARGATIDDFDLRNMPARVAAVGDLWAPLLAKSDRFDLAPLVAALR